MHSTTSGRLLGYTQYREAHAAAPPGAVHWGWRSILDALAGAAAGERGSLTLSTSGDPAGCELVPGMAITVQVVPAGGHTRLHAHAWWHLFFVQNGEGTAVVDAQDTRVLARGDVLFVPAWIGHHFENRGDDALVLLSMTNLPQQAALANHRSVEP